MPEFDLPVVEREAIQARERLVKNGIEVDEIEGLYRAENTDLFSEEFQKYIQGMVKDTYSFKEVYGDYCPLNMHINVPCEMAYEYAANIYSLEEYTMSLRDFRHLGGGLYVARENLGPAAEGPQTLIYMRVELHPTARAVDYLCAWDQGHEMWMRYYFRFLDCQKVFNRPGTILTWINCKHPYYDRDSPAPPHIEAGRSRKDRETWVGDLWDIFYPLHKIEADNMKAILEARFAAGIR